MNRRAFVMTAGIVGTVALAGCTGDSNDDGSDPATPTEAATATEPDSGDGSGEPTLTATVEPSSSAVCWGEEYTLNTTIAASSDDRQFATAVVYKTASDTEWTAGIDGTEAMWTLSAGQSKTKEFDIQPPETGELTLGLLTGEYETLDQWDLTVRPPTAAFGETVSWYDGLELTLDARITETIAVHVFSTAESDEQDLGVHPVRPTNHVEKRWLLVTVRAENNTVDQDVHVPWDEQFDVLVGGEPVELQRYMINPADDPGFEVLDETTKPVGSIRLGSESDYYDWSEGTTLPPTASTTGWLPYIVDADTTLDDVGAMARHNEVRARWE